MKIKSLLTIGIVALVLAVTGGFWLYNWVLGDTESASELITAPTLAVAEPYLATQAPAREETPETSTTVSPSTALQPVQTENPAESSTRIFEISQDGSEARFIIYELLRGEPKDVIGITSQVAGQVALNITDLSSARVGEILINTRTLATDDERRNQAIRNRILFTDQYEYIRFLPTRVIGLQGTGEISKTYTFQVEGELSIRDITKPVTFDISITSNSLDQLTGFATAIIRRTDFDLNIPDVPFVANVGEEITLEIDLELNSK